MFWLSSLYTEITKKKERIAFYLRTWKKGKNWGILILKVFNVPCYLDSLSCLFILFRIETWILMMLMKNDRQYLEHTSSWKTSSLLFVLMKIFVLILKKDPLKSPFSQKVQILEHKVLAIYSEIIQAIDMNKKIRCCNTDDLIAIFRIRKYSYT